MHLVTVSYSKLWARKVLSGLWPWRGFKLLTTPTSWFSGDIRSYGHVEKALKGVDGPIDTVYHLYVVVRFGLRWLGVMVVYMRIGNNLALVLCAVICIYIYLSPSCFPSSNGELYTAACVWRFGAYHIDEAGLQLA